MERLGIFKQYHQGYVSGNWHLSEDLTESDLQGQVLQAKGMRKV